MESHSPYLNRELSWIEFNSRVLEEALDQKQPLLERLKFLSIFSTNLDEFFMIRVSGLQDQLEADDGMLSPDGLSAAAQLQRISDKLRPLLRIQSSCLLEEILPGLVRFGVRIARFADLAAHQRAELGVYFEERVFPVLTPLSVDPSHPFPYISNISLNLGILLASADGDTSDQRFARVKLPPSVPRLIPVGSENTFVLLEDLISANIGKLFPRIRVLECQPFRITRNADMEIEEDEADDLLRSVELQLRQRRFGFGVRLEVSEAMNPRMVDLLTRSLELTPQDVYPVSGPLNIPDLMSLYKLDLPELKDKPHTPTIPGVFRQTETVFDAIWRQDILLHHPYESFGPILEFVRAAATDPNVLAIKMTLYRAGPNSPIVTALIDAAERGKQVAVLVELKARFDEENNIIWARQLEKAGVHVIYGIIGLKTHAKVALVVRAEGNALRRYVHLGTGNYNPVTARIYTDFGLLTANPEFGADCSELFNYMTGYSGQDTYRKLVVAPLNLRSRLAAMIRREVEHHRAGRPAGIFAKTNALTDHELIDEFYDASAEGLPIDLLVRGICCLRPGIPGRSETIRVASVVGRFLEHSRVYRFLNGGNEEIYLSSADLMSRNLDRRLEVMFPLEDPAIRDRVRREAIELPFADRAKLRWLSSDGSYTRAGESADEALDYQTSLMR
ncbi:MAG TPA: polyphosphate kinase 1 [Terriglobia bacterium]|nr:polyphosphate kinase 1 [Terriglobia bacterium]